MKLANFIILFIIYGSVNSEISYLRHVHILYRHGDRSPMIIYPTDSNKIDRWPSGLGQLTHKGIIEHFQLGLWLRKRYKNFLGENLDNSLMYVRSSDIDRTLMSAESNLAGLLYNSSGEIIKGLKWIPFPIHTVESKSDMLLLGKENCAAYQDLYNQLFNLDIFKKKFQLYQATLDVLRAKTGIGNLAYSDVWKIYDTLFCEREHNLKNDDWVTDAIWRDVVALNNLNWEVMTYGVLAKVSGGILLKRIVKNITLLTESHPSSKFNRSKVIMYSGHDTDVAPVASLLGIFDNIQPVYTSCLLFELHYVPSRVDKWAVKVFYKNYTDSNGSTNIPAAIVPGCDSELCSLDQFILVTKPKFVSVKEYREVCNSRENIIFIVQILFAVVTISCILLIIAMFAFKAYRKPRQHRYAKLNTDPNIN